VKYFLRFEYGYEERMSKDFGPFNDFLQLTYKELRDSDGTCLATYYEGFWYAAHPNLGDTNTPWSDIVIWARCESNTTSKEESET
jgi:hypothetical protein